MNVPVLRFPEFLEDWEWVLEEFSKYIVLYRGSSPRPIQDYLTSDSSGVNWIKIGDTKYTENFVINQVEERITPEGAKKSRKVNVGELILANSMSYGKTYQLAIAGYIYDGWFVLRDYEKHFDKQFLLQLLNSEYMQDQYKRFSAGGIVQNISSDIVYKTVLPNTSLEEQQKIAACLSSLDELITAQAQKVEALKTHKKGLMQQLFPAEGETVPKLRFSEFREAREWKIRELREFITERSHIPVDKLPLFSLTIEDGVTPKTERYERSFLVKDEKDAYKLACPNDFAYNPMNLRFGAIGRYSGCQNVALSKYYNIFYCDETVDSRFCEIYFKSDGMLTHYDDVATGSLIEKRRVHFSSFLKIKIVFPSLLEQQKIADCLSSLDELITAQAQKLNALKTHKKGLMQQLFPAVDEVNA
jgi:type I restriction enzyme S subunit